MRGLAKRNVAWQWRCAGLLPAGCAGLMLLAGAAVRASPVNVPASAASRLAAGESQDLIVEYDSTDIDLEAAALRGRAGLVHEDEAILARKVSRFAALKAAVHVAMPSGEMETLQEYSHLPMALHRVKSLRALQALSRDPRVIGIYLDEQKYSTAASDLSFVNQPPVVAAGDSGQGTTVMVLDSGVDYTLVDFGSCTAPGMPASCRVVAGPLDDCHHGTNVSAIIASVAPKARLAVYDVATCTNPSSWQWTTYDSTVIAGINWAIAHKSTYNIVALNMSLGSNALYVGSCGAGNAYTTPINQARAAGILPVASSGNAASATSMASPACVPGVLGVGAVYDVGFQGGIGFAGCSDSNPKADQVVCFSNSDSALSVLAPGVWISAGGLTGTGTSMAAPFVSGSAAVLRAAFPTETLDQSAARMVNGGVPITDSRNGLTKPRLDLWAADLRNDSFANRATLNKMKGAVTVISRIATLEVGEPHHAGLTGGKSVWWKWLATISGTVRFNTHGSSFDTVLAVYTGGSVTALTAVASNNNDGSTGGVSGVSFQAKKGVEYEIAVDGVAGASGTVVLNWNQAAWLVPIVDYLLR